MVYEELIQPVLWAVAAITALGLVANGFRLARKSKVWSDAKSSLVKAALVTAAALVIIPALGIVPAGHRGVVYDVSGGVAAGERGEGVTLLIPWVQHMRNMSVRTQKLFSDKVYAQSLDLQEITVVASVNYRVNPAKAAELYRDVGEDYEQVTIQPALFQRTKAAVGRVKAEDFAARRAGLAAKIQKQLESQLGGYGITVEYVNIEDAVFDPEFVAAVKAKIIADQYAQEQRRLVEAEEAIKDQKIIQARATARSTEIEAYAQARANQALASSLTPYMLRWQWLKTWDGTLPTTLAGAGSSLMLLLDGKTEQAPATDTEGFSPEEFYEEEVQP